MDWIARMKELDEGNSLKGLSFEALVLVIGIIGQNRGGDEVLQKYPHLRAGWDEYVAWGREFQETCDSLPSQSRQA